MFRLRGRGAVTAMCAIALLAACEDAPPGGGGASDTGLARDIGGGAPDTGLDDSGAPIDTGVTDPPDTGFDDNGNPIDGGVVPDTGFDDNGNPIDTGVTDPPDTGFDDNGNPIDGGVAPDTGFDDAGQPIDSGVVSSPDTGFDDAGRPIDSGVAPDTGLDDAGRPIDSGVVSSPDTGFDDAGRPIDSGVVSSPDTGFDDAGIPIDGGSPDTGPLTLPYSEFCTGTGAVVEVGGTGECSGGVASRTFRFALCTCNTVTLQSNIEIDAFDSRNGPYGASTPMGPNILEDGHVGIDGTLSAGGSMDVLGSVFVSGGGFTVGQRSHISINVYAADDAIQTNSFTDVGRNMFINGDIIGRYDITQQLFVPVGSMVDPATLMNLGMPPVVYGPIPAITPCPCGPSELLDVQAFVDYGESHNDNAITNVITSTTWESGLGPDVITLPCGRYYLTQIIHPRGIDIRATDRTVLYVDGDVTLGGGLRLEVDPGAEIDLFIAGSLTLQAASRLGDEDRPSAVRTYVGGSSPIDLGASTLFGGNLYAPSADVNFNASADLYGALFANNAMFSGSAEIHFDSAIRAAGQECFPDAGPGGGGDAGVGDGGGAPPSDGGVPADGGDAGGDDAGSDAGADAGTPDSGQPCLMCYDCGQYACIIPPGGGTGVCGMCTSDLDCCPTDICDETTGLCRPTL